MTVTYDDIIEARARIEGVVWKTPCSRSESLSKRTGCNLYLKLENLQMTGSFKERGATNCLSLLTSEERQRGIIAASAGNHAQGVALAAHRFHIVATIVMPETTPLVKVTQTRQYGANVVLHGDSYAQAHAHALTLQKASGATLVHAFDDDAIIAGQGTVGLEILEQVPDVDLVVVPVGGGGLISGVSIAVHETAPQVQVYGVESVAVPSMLAALNAGHPVAVPDARTIADGIAVRKVGDHTLPLVQEHVRQVLTVDEEELAEAVLVLLEVEKTVSEGAGAAALAAVLQGSVPVSGRNVVVIVSGGNIDVNLVARIISRGLMKSGRSMRVQVELTDVPGALAALLAVVASCKANVLQVSHDRTAMNAGMLEAWVELTLETRGFSHGREVLRALAAAGFRTQSD